MSIADITLPEDLTEIADCLFSNCESLTEIILPENVTYIGACVEICSA